MRIEGKYKTKKYIRRIAKEFYENSGPELEYINLSIEKSIYTYIYIFYYQNLYSKFLCLLPVRLWLHIPRLFIRRLSAK